MKIDFSAAREAIRKAYLELRFDDVLQEPYQLRWVPAAKGVPSFDTACWCWMPRHAPPSHLITFGEKLAERCRDSALLCDYALLYFRHELEHSLSTERDLKAIADKCRKVGVSFSGLNWAEDARIEAIARQRWGKKFDWLAFENAGTDQSPAGLLFQLIQADGDVAIVESRAGPGTTASVTLGRVADFYHRFVAAPSTWGVIPILVEWVKEFGNPPTPDGAGGDLAAAAALAANPSGLSELLANSQEISGGPTADSKPASTDTGSVTCEVSGNHDFLSEGGHTALDSSTVDALVGILKTAFKRGRVKEPTLSPPGRLSLKALVRGSEKAYRRVVIQEGGRRRKVHYYHDCSGSMRGMPQRAGLHLLAALSSLASAGIVEGWATLTMQDSKNRAVHQTFRLPLSPAGIEKIPAVGGAECFDNAFKQTRALLHDVDLVLAYSDGEICDEPIDQSQWRRRGLFSVGLYVGGDKSESLRRWFNSAVCRESVEGLALELSEILKTSGRR